MPAILPVKWNVTRECALVRTERRTYSRFSAGGEWHSSALTGNSLNPITLRKGSRLDRALDRFAERCVEAGIRTDGDF